MESIREKLEDGRDGWEEEGIEECHKPKRLEEAMVTYLLNLETQMSTMVEDSDEAKELFVENVLTEIKQSTASAACDRRTNTVVEKICYNATLPNIIEIMARFSNYSVFLARNRHASHVVQALLARLCSILKFTGIGEIEENIVVSTVLQFVRPILKEIYWLIKEQAASHVVRSILCLLAGMPTISEKKGKGSKHPHSVAFSEPLDSVCDKKKFYVSKNVCFDVPDDFHEAFGVAILSIVQLSVSQLQDLVADWSGCAVLAIIIRIASNPDLVMGGSELCLRLFHNVLEWTEDPTHGASVFYAMAADKAASYFLEAMIECCDASFFITIVNSAVMNKSEEYAADPAANFVLQTVLKRLSVALELAPSEDAPELQSLARALLKELGSKKIFESLLYKRGGVALWMLELARHTFHKRKEKEKKSWGEKLGKAVLKFWIRGNKNDENKGSDNEEDDDMDVNSRLVCTLVRQLAKGKEESGGNKDQRKEEDTKGNIASSYQSKGPIKSNGTTETPAALLTGRLVGALMNGGESSVTEPLAEGLSSLPSDTLLHLASSGPLSKSILDPFVAYCQDGSHNSLLTPPLSSLSPEQTVQMATHFIGQHLFRKMYEACVDTPTKEKIVQSLELSRSVVNKTKEGRASMKVCHADMYRRQPDEWHTLMKRQARANAIVVELTEQNSGSTSSAAKGRDKSDKEQVSESVEQQLDSIFTEKATYSSEMKKVLNRPKSRPLDANYGIEEKQEPVKKKKKRSGNQSSRENWFRKRQEAAEAKRVEEGAESLRSGGREREAGREKKNFAVKRKGVPTTGTDYEKLAKLKSSKLGLDLNQAIDQLAKEKM